MKRKIPFINSHIFRQPDIPWGSGAFDPFSLNPDLFLDARDVEANIIASGVDDRSVAILDQSEGLAETLVKEFDFSGGIDGLSQSGGVLSAPNTILGKDNVVKLTLSGGATFHRIIELGLTLGVTYRHILSVYVPSGQTINGFELIAQSTVVPNGNYQGINGSWVDIDISTISGGTNLAVRALSGANTTPSADNDVFYVANSWTTSIIQGSHFTQLTAANRGLVDSATVPTQIEYDGVSDYSENTLDIAKFAAMSTGSVIGICDSNTGVSRAYFAIGDMASNNNNFLTYFDTNNKAVLQIRGVSGVLNLIVSTTVCVDGDVVEWKLVGSAKKCFINGIEDTVIVSFGTNGTQWMDYLDSTYGMSIGSWQRTIPVYYDITFKHLSIFSTPLTDAESADYANYLIEKHNL
jgi:hypothetical protein